MRLTLANLLRWARGRSPSYVEIYCDGSAEVQMGRDDYATRYLEPTLYLALRRAYMAERKRT